MKYLLDTNLVSQYAKPKKDPRADAWFDRTNDNDLYLSALTIAEIWQGIDQMATGEKKTKLEVWAEYDLIMHFSGRMIGLSLDSATVRASG